MKLPAILVRSYAAVVVALLTTSAGAAHAVTLYDATSLPTQQGWIADDAGSIFNPSDAFSLVDGALHQDTIALGHNGQSGSYAGYVYNLPPLSSDEFALTLRARVSACDGDGYGGFMLALYSGTRRAAVSIAQDHFTLLNTDASGGYSGSREVFGYDNASYHDFTIVGSFASGWDFYRDGTLVTSAYSANIATGYPLVAFGDQSSGSNAIVDIQSLTLVPEPASLGILALGAAAVLAGRRRR